MFFVASNVKQEDLSETVHFRDATGTGNRPVETSFFRSACLEISSIFSWIFGQFLQKSRVQILCFAYQTSSVDVCGKVY